jgi:cell wall-associated NlpC family hydrolase
MTNNANSPEKKGFLESISDKISSASEVLRDATESQLDYAKSILGVNTELQIAKEKEQLTEGNEKRSHRENTLGVFRKKNRLQQAQLLTAQNTLTPEGKFKDRARDILKQSGFDGAKAKELLELEIMERGTLARAFAFKRGKDAEWLPTEEMLKGNIQEWDEIIVDFGRNMDANARIGAADILPPPVQIVKIIDKDQNVRIGVRKIIDGRAGYYDANNKYIPIYTGYALRIPTALELKRSEFTNYGVTKSIETDPKKLEALESEDKKAMQAFREILEKTREEDIGSALYRLISQESGTVGTYKERLSRMLDRAKKYETEAKNEEKKPLQDLITRLSKTAELLKDKNFSLDFDRYKGAIAKHESGGKGYFARNDEDGKKRNIRPGAWAFGKYQFTVETLRDYGVDLGIPPEEGKIQAFLENGNLQEEIMDTYMIRNLEKHILPNQKIMEDMARDGTSLSYYLALTHIGGPGALSGNKSMKDWLGTSTHSYAMGVSNVYERAVAARGTEEAIVRIDPLPGAKITSEELIRFAEEHIGKPYKLGANGDVAIDCSQLVVEALKKARVVHSRFDTTAANFSLNSTPKEVSATERGDLVFLRKSGRVTHVAIALWKPVNGEIEIIDASTNTGMVSKRKQKITSEVEVGKLYAMV